MSKVISLKIEEKILEDADIMVSKLGISRNKYINEAIEAYSNAKKRAAMEEQIKKEVALIRESSSEVLAEFEALKDDFES
jgi:dsDNA-specific endonuclease/ATPase MutS2